MTTGRKDFSDTPSRFFPGTAHSYDTVVRLFTLGLDIWWKRAMLKRLSDASRILDLACGTGIVSRRLSFKFPGAEIVGVDLTEDYLAVYRSRIERGKFKAKAVLGNAETVELDGSFDAVVASYLPKYVRAEILLSNLIPRLRPGAVVVFHDFTMPPRSWSRFVWNAYAGVMNAIGGRLFPEWRAVFGGELTKVIAETTWFEEFPVVMHRLGFVEVRAMYLSFGSAGLVVGTWPS